MKKNLALLCLLALVSFLAPAFAESIVVRSPDKNRTWSQAEEESRAFVWDAKAGKFSLFLTYSNIDDASRVNTPQTETLSFSFPGVTWDAAQKLFVLALPGGKTVPVAEKKMKLFMPNIVLLPGNHVAVESPDGVLTVSLDIRN